MFKLEKEELEINGKTLTLETGKIARQADGAITVSYTHLTLPTKA